MHRGRPAVLARRLPWVLLLLAAAAAMLTVSLAATSSARIRASENRPLLPDRNPIYGRDAVGLAVNPNDSDHIVALYADWTTLWCEVASSFDGGETWDRIRLKAPAGFVSPPCTVGNHLSNQIDGGIAFGRGDTVYATFASAILDEEGEGRGRSVLVAKSTNGGRTFGVGAVALRGGQDDQIGPDYVFPKLAVEPGRKRLDDRLYLVAASRERPAGAKARSENTVMAVSDNSGQTWSAPRQANPSDQNAIEQSQPVIGRGGAVYVAWRTRGRDPKADGKFVPEGKMIVAKTRDGGQTFQRTEAAGVRGYVYEGVARAPFASSRIFTASTFPRLAADRRSGNLYLVYGNGARPTRPGSATASDHFIHPDLDVYFQRSTDGGDSWSDAKRLNRQADVQNEITQTRHPNLSVAPNGRLDIVWHDRRHWYRGCFHTHSPCDEARLGDTYHRSSSDGGKRFSRERRITDRSINNDVGYDYRFGTYWDYGPQPLPLGNGRLLVGWMDSRDGNVETDNQGLYLADVDMDASKRIPVRRFAGRDASGLSVGLSQLAYPGGGEAVLAGTFASRPATRVVIVNERDVAGALAGGVLARANLGPVLVSPAGGLSDAVKDELARLQPIGAYLIGGERSLSSAIATELAATGIPANQITRLAGADAAGTAQQIAAAMDRRTPQERQANGQAFDAAVIVNPSSPDAVAASVLAANRRLPVLLTGRNALPAASAEAVRSLGIQRTLVIGSRKWVGRGVTGQLPKPHRLGGRNVDRTSREVVSESRRRGVPQNMVYVTRAAHRMDAAVMGAAVGRIGGLMLLSDGPDDARETLADLKIGKLIDRIVFVERSRKKRKGKG